MGRGDIANPAKRIEPRGKKWTQSLECSSEWERIGDLAVEHLEVEVLGASEVDGRFGGEHRGARCCETPRGLLQDLADLAAG
jgi:hypothetical protein